MTISRRELGNIFLTAALSVSSGAADSRIGGVLIGAQSYSFRDRPLDGVIAAMNEIGLSECELWQGHVEPRSHDSNRREELRKWRTTVPLSYFEQIRDRFAQAKISLSAYNYSFRDDFTDEEINRGFEMAKALGVHKLTASSTVSVTHRVAVFAAKHRMMVGMHGHDNLADPNEFARPASFEAAMKESRWIGLNLDIGHFTAAGYDPVEYLKRFHDRTVTLHIKDRKRQQGPNMPFGQGDTPVKEILLLLKERGWPIPANIEYAYKGGDTVAEVGKCYAFCKNILA